MRATIVSSDALPTAPELTRRKDALRRYAETNRSDLTAAESKMWSALRDRGMAVDFECQVPLLNFVVDFYCPEVGLVIEIDGVHHYGDAEQRRHDAHRTRRLEAELGLTVLRFGNDDVNSQFEYVIYKIADAVVARLDHPSSE